MKGMKASSLTAIIDFLYLGEANVFQEELDSFLALAEELQLKGLEGNSEGKVPNYATDPFNHTEWVDVNEKQNILKRQMSSYAKLEKEHMGAKMMPFKDCESFARRTFTTPKIRTFATPKFGHLPPLKTIHLPGGQLPPPIFFFFFWRTFLGFFDLQLMEDIKGGKEEVLDEVVMEHIK